MLDIRTSEGAIVMNGDPLLSCRIKIDRAIKHFNDFTQVIKVFAARNTHSFWVDEDSEPAIQIYRIRIEEDIPVEWSGYIGDVIHNLRSSLDCIATELVLRYGQNVTEKVLRDTYFPIVQERTKLSSKKPVEFFARVGPRVERLIRLLQPYCGGRGHALWQLHQLDVADKHRRILVARTAVTNVEFSVPAPLGRTVLNKLPFPLKDGDEVCRVVFFEPHFNAAAHFTVDVAFNEPIIAERALVIPTLSKFINYSQRVHSIFEKSCF
jgi:hypothetical protein